MQVSVWDEEPRVNNKTKHRLFWIMFGIVISILAAAAFCIPLGISLARNVDTATTTQTATVATATLVTTTTGVTTTTTTTTTTGK
jgi:ABC-type dipeptide/oligopeptide/nickel transport system permease component